MLYSQCFIPLPLDPPFFTLLFQKVILPVNRRATTRTPPMLPQFFRRRSSQHQDNIRRPLLQPSARREDSFSNEDELLSNEDEDDDDNGPLPIQRQSSLPIFSAAQLGMTSLDVGFLELQLISLERIPVYHLQHSIRLLIISKCDTTLSWDQMRSPQVSSFLVKPIDREIRDTSHHSKATVYALLANCLQFQKDCQLNPALQGINRTRALLSELLAMRFVREASTREVSIEAKEDVG
jgi:hypothetical protein